MVLLLLLLFIFSGLVVASLSKTSRCASWGLRAPHPTPPSPPLFRQSGGAFWDTRRKKCLTKHGFYVCGQENTNFFAWKYSSVKHVSQNNSTDCSKNDKSLGNRSGGLHWSGKLLSCGSWGWWRGRKNDLVLLNDFGFPTYIIEHSVIEINRIRLNFIKQLKTIEQNWTQNKIGQLNAEPTTENFFSFKMSQLYILKH